jgi:K+-sensing histidine kinase KdpD
MGMGLAVSSAILREHGGRMWAENSPDGGAVFFFTLPVQRDESSNNVRVHH